MDELMSILRSMRTDADQAIQLLTSGQPATGSKPIHDAAAILDRIKTWRDELDRLIEKHGGPRDERA